MPEVAYQHSYDANGNITQIDEVFTVGTTEKSRVLAQYTYDGLNQLTKETRYTYSGTSTTATDTTVVDYVIDTAGNLRSVTTTVNGTQTDQISYTYGNTAWADKLTAVTVNGTKKTIQYADTLNPKSWYNGTSYTNLTWTQGRRLSSIKKGTETYSYEYDMSGVRSAKVVNGERHEYVTQNGRVVRDYVTYAGTDTFVRCTDFFYDEAGRPFAMRCYYDSTLTGADTFHYVLNAQGDVVQLNYQGGTVYAEYSYDAWGNVTSIKGNSNSGSLYYAERNPLRYRGYYYDTETGFYYLQSRYYDPAVKRFLNADSYGSTGQGFTGFNMFAYCGNNPVNMSDSTGNRPEWERIGEYTDTGTGEPEDIRPSPVSIAMKEEVMALMNSSTYTNAGFVFKSVHERQLTLEYFFMELQTIMGITDYSIVFGDLPIGVMGRTSDSLKRIVISNKAAASMEAFQIVAHEAYHAYQFKVLAREIKYTERATTINRWAYEINHYLGEDSPYCSYYNQYLEISANWFSGLLMSDKLLGLTGYYYRDH